MALKNTAFNSKVYNEDAVFEELLIDSIVESFEDFNMHKTFSNLFHYVIAKIEQANIECAFEEGLTDLSDYIIEIGEVSASLLRQIAESEIISNEALQRIQHLSKLYYLGESVQEGKYDFSLSIDLDTKLENCNGERNPYRLLEKAGRFFTLLMNFHGTCQQARISTIDFENLCDKILNQLVALSSSFDTDVAWLEDVAGRHEFSSELSRFRKLLMIIIDGFKKFTQFSSNELTYYSDEFPNIPIELHSLIDKGNPLKKITDYLNEFQEIE